MKYNKVPRSDCAKLTRYYSNDTEDIAVPYEGNYCFEKSCVLYSQIKSYELSRILKNNVMLIGNKYNCSFILVKLKNTDLESGYSIPYENSPVALSNRNTNCLTKLIKNNMLSSVLGGFYKHQIELNLNTNKFNLYTFILLAVLKNGFGEDENSKDSIYKNLFKDEKNYLPEYEIEYIKDINEYIIKAFGSKDKTYNSIFKNTYNLYRNDYEYLLLKNDYQRNMIAGNINTLEEVTDNNYFGIMQNDLHIAKLIARKKEIAILLNMTKSFDIIKHKDDIEIVNRQKLPESFYEDLKKELKEIDRLLGN